MYQDQSKHEINRRERRRERKILILAFLVFAALC